MVRMRSRVQSSIGAPVINLLKVFIIARHFTKSESAAWFARLPKKTVGVKVIVQSDRRRILIVKPNYKKGWQLPGGTVEKNEDPLKAIVRELNEETGITSTTNEYSLIGTVYRLELDGLILIYELGKIVHEGHTLTIPNMEISDFDFVEPSQVAGFLGEHYHSFLKTYMK